MPIALLHPFRRLICNIPLRWALTVPFVASTVGATALVGHLSYRSGQAAVENLGHQLIDSTNQRVIQNLEAYLQTPLLINRLNVDAVTQGQLDLENSPALEAALLNRLQQFDHVSAVLFASPQGMFRAVERLPDFYLSATDPPQLDQISVYRLDRQGKRGALVHVETGLNVRRDRPWYNRAVTARRLAWNPIFQYGSFNTLTLNASQPVYDAATNRLLGVFSVHLRLDYLSEVLRHFAIGRSGQVMIVDQQGELIATSTQERPYTFITQPGSHRQFKQLQLNESQNELTRSLGDYLRHHAVFLNTQSQPQELTFNFNGERQFVKITPFEDQYGLNWRIITVIPESYFLGPIQANTRNTVLVSLLVLAVAIALGLLTTHQLVKHVAQFTRFSRELATGNLDRRLPTNSTFYELNSLAQMVNHMAERLQQSFNGIKIALEESDEKFATIFRASPDPIAIASLEEGRILEANDSLREFFGYTWDEMDGRTALDLNIWSNLEERDRYRTLLQQQGKVRNLEVHLRVKSGEIKPVLLSADIQTLEGQTCLIVMQRDISTLKQVEDRLRKTEHWLHQHSRLSPSNFYTLVEEPDGRFWFEYISSAVETIHEIAVDQVLQDASLVLNAIHPEDRAGWMAAVCESKQALSPFSHQWRIITPSGVVKWLQANSQPDRRDHGATAWHGVVTDITDRKAAELALQQSETLNRVILQALPDLIIRMHRDGTYLDIKPTTAFPIERPNFKVGKNIRINLPLDEAQPHLDAVAQALQTGESQVYEFPTWVEGQYLWQEARVVPLNADEVLVVIRDLTQRKQAEDALRKSEARLAMSQQVAQVGYWEFDFATQTRTWSNLSFLQWGFEPTQPEPSFDELLQRVHPDDRAAFLQQRDKAVEAGVAYAIDLRVVHPDGSIHYLDSRSEPVVNEHGEVVKLVGTSLDVTERKQIEAALQESEARFRQLAETVQEGFFVFETESAQYSYVNPAYSAILGTSCQSLYQGMFHWLNNIHPDDRNRIDAALQREGQGETLDQEYRFIRPDGELCWLRSQAFPLRDETGAIVRVVGIVEDISVRKQLEQSLRSQAEEERLLAIITQHIRQSLNLEEILATTVVEVQQTLKADRVLIVRLNPDGSGQVIQESVVPDYPVTGQMHWDDEQVSAACYDYYRRGIPRIVPDVARDDWASCVLELMPTAGVKSKIVAPIVQSMGEVTTVWGLLVVQACSHYRQWQVSEADFLQQLCNQLAIAIDQASLYQQVQTELAERQQAEAALRQSEARLALSQRVAHLGSWEFNFESQTRTWSVEVFNHWGFDPTHAQPSFAELLERVHPDDRAIFQQSIEMAVMNGTPYALDLRVVHPDGSIRYLDSRGESLLDARGTIVKLIGTSLDITERKQTELALQEREAMLRAIGDNLPRGFIYQRVHEPGKGFRYSYVSAGVERLLGIKPDEMLKNAQVTRRVGFAADLAIADQAVQESLKNLTPIELQMRNRTAQGEIQWSSIRSRPRRLDDGRTVWDGVEVDITELKRIEAALRFSEEQFRNAFDGAPIGISLVTATGQFVKANARYCDILGYTEEELLKLTFQDITHPDDLEEDIEGLRQMMTGEIGSYQIEKRYITKQGTAIPVLINAAAIMDQDGQPLYSVGHVQDIRDRLKVERMKSEFISVVSHELRTPLTSIRGALGILGSGVFDDRPEKAKHMLNIAISNSDRLVRLVNDILSLERLESGKVQLVIETCQVSDLMQQAIDGVQAIADQSGITLCPRFLAATLWAEPDAIIQILINLLSNAIKFSAAGDTIWVTAELGNGETWPNAPSLPQVPMVLFSVIDQGRGVPVEKLEAIFEQFQQVDGSDSRKKGGTGLGLAICKNIVHQHGGQIWVKSVLGQGSTFCFVLPLNGKDNRE